MSLHDLKNSLLEKIKSGEVKMHSKGYFFAKSALQILGLILAVLLALFLVSYVFFHLKVSGAFGFTNFGILGIRDLLLSLPWLMLFLVLIFIALLLWFAEHYPLTYRNPLLYSVAGILLVVFLGGYLVAKTPLHPYFFRLNAGGPGAPRGSMMFGLYSERRRPALHNGLVGKIEAWMEDNRVVRDFSGQAYQVKLSDDVDWPPEGDVFQPGDVVIIHGQVDDGRVTAWGIRKIQLDSPRMNFPMMYPNDR